ncbi:MAG: poly-gamma-glutamate hydrolase family protein, partial [Gammaproteobacteria bacterium]
PMCLTLIGQSEIVITIHGEHSDEDGDGVFVGGLDDRLGRRLGRSLKAAGFDVGRHSDPNLQGIELSNLCNRGKTGRGVQLELSRNVRKQMFSSLTRAGRKVTKPPFRRFVAALRRVLA